MTNNIENEVTEKSESLQTIQEEIKNSLKKWGIGLILLGIIHIILTKFLDPIWGILIIILGILNLTSKNHIMFIVNGIALIFVAFSNILSSVLDGINQWLFLGIMQIVWGIQEIIKFKTFKNRIGNSKSADETTPDTAISEPKLQNNLTSKLGLTSIILTGVAFVLEIIFIINLILGKIPDEVQPDETSVHIVVTNLILLIIPFLLVTGLGFGIAGLIEKGKKKATSVIGVIINFFQLLVILILFLFGSMAS